MSATFPWGGGRSGRAGRALLMLRTAIPTNAAGAAKASGVLPVATSAPPSTGPPRIPIDSTVLDATLAPTSSSGARAREGSIDM